MKLIIHDLNEDTLQRMYPHIADEDIIISDHGSIHPCIAMCSEMLIISKCIYGSYSPFVKNVLDRSISYIHPYFAIKNGEMHHQQRYKRDFRLKVIFYGSDLTAREKETAQKLVKANAVNLYCNVESVTFLDSVPEMEVPNI